MLIRRLVILATTAFIAAACGDSTGITVEDLAGDWEATQFRFTNNSNSSEVVDLITGGATLDVIVAASGTVTSVFDDGQGGSSSDSGTFSASGTTLTIAGDTFEAERSGDVLILTDENNEYDFDNDGSDDPATLQIRLERQ